MLAMAFEITPAERRLIEPMRPAPGPDMAAEVTQALRVLERVKRLWNIDEAVSNDAKTRALAVDGMEQLLRTADYDMDAWREWVRTHPVRPLEI